MHPLVTVRVDLDHERDRRAAHRADAAAAPFRLLPASIRALHAQPTVATLEQHRVARVDAADPASPCVGEAVAGSGRCAGRPSIAIPRLPFRVLLFVFIFQKALFFQVPN